jgi:hypothetical protein
MGLSLFSFFLLSHFAIYFSGKNLFSKMFDGFERNAFRIFIFASLVVALAFLDRLHAISKTRQYLEQDMGSIWKFVNQGYKIGLYHMGLVGLFFSVGPLVIGVLLTLLTRFKMILGRDKLIVLALFYFLILFSLKAFYVNYYFYYSRYYFGEIIPLIYVIFGVVGYRLIDEFIKKQRSKSIFTGATLALAILTALPFVLGYEGPGKSFFRYIENNTTTNDLIVVDSKNLWPRNEVLPGLIFFLERKVFVLKSLEDIKLESVKNLMNQFQRVFVLTQNTPQEQHTTLAYDFHIYTGSRRHLFEGLNTFKEIKFPWPKVLPNKSVVKRSDYYFYQAK